MENNVVRKQKRNRSGSCHVNGLAARVTKEGISVESYVNPNNLLPILECVTNHIFKTIAKRTEIPQSEITVKMLQAFSNGVAGAVKESKEAKPRLKRDIDPPPLPLSLSQIQKSLRKYLMNLWERANDSADGYDGRGNARPQEMVGNAPDWHWWHGRICDCRA